MDATLHIGIDDTDSPEGMCTTFLAYKIAGRLRERGAEFLGFPRLVRLNPNIPWKTRGNGAVALKVRTASPSDAKDQVRGLVERYSDTPNGANPGLVFLEGLDVPDALARFSELALWQLVGRGKARRLAAEHGLDFSFRGNGQGLVGAIGAVGYRFGDHTLELLSYRRRRMFGKRRAVSARSVRRMQEENPDTFCSFDEKRRRVLITPRGPDPVFCGIRGESAPSLLRAAGTLEAGERLDGHMIFQSNQGTGDHLKNRLGPADLRPYASGTLTGTVAAGPRTARGGHAFFTISLEGGRFGCAVYRPTGMAQAAMGLIPGDRIRVGGGVRRASRNFPRVLNVESMEVLSLARNEVSSNPLCGRCSKSMKSKGAGQGYRCARCGARSAERRTLVVPRRLERRLYLPEISAHRHLSRPAQRAGRINPEPAFSESLPWLCRYGR